MTKASLVSAVGKTFLDGGRGFVNLKFFVRVLDFSQQRLERRELFFYLPTIPSTPTNLLKE